MSPSAFITRMSSSSLTASSLALCRGRENDFGQALEQLVAEEEESMIGRGWHTQSSDEKQISTKHDDSTGSDATKRDKRDAAGRTTPISGENPTSQKSRFVWWGKPIWRDLGYTAAAIQLFAATIFWVATM